MCIRDRESDELNGFDLGVDEYISKPFSPKILVARVEAILRRSNNLSTGCLLYTSIFWFHRKGSRESLHRIWNEYRGNKSMV